MAENYDDLIEKLKVRFDENMDRHKEIEWKDVEARLKGSGQKLWSLSEMEKSGGEPDVVGYDKTTGEYFFFDCSAETPIGRRNVCYDKEGEDSRKFGKPLGNAIEMAKTMGVEVLTEEQYRELQNVGSFDTKTSSWLKTSANIRKLGGAIFGDRRYGSVFVYHNGASSYYSARGFRALLRV